MGWVCGHQTLAQCHCQGDLLIGAGVYVHSGPQCQVPPPISISWNLTPLEVSTKVSTRSRRQTQSSVCRYVARILPQPRARRPQNPTHAVSFHVTSNRTNICFGSGWFSRKLTYLDVDFCPCCSLNIERALWPNIHKSGINLSCKIKFRMFCKWGWRKNKVIAHFKAITFA